MNKQGKKAIDKIIVKAQKKIDKAGMYENAGYSTQSKVEEALDYLDLSYQEKSELMAYFYHRCDTLNIGGVTK